MNQFYAIVVFMLVAVLAVQIGMYRTPPAFGTAPLSDMAPEVQLYGTSSNVTAEANAHMQRNAVTDIQQALTGICRNLYYMGTINGCSNVNESFTWSFMLQNGNTGTLSSVLGATSSSTFTCGTAAAYGVYALNNVYSDLTGYSYNLNKSDGSGVISGQADPCAYQDIVL